MNIYVDTDAEFTFWSGAHAQDGVAVLVCFALNCYHSVTTYTWYHDDDVIIGNSYPVFYAERSGKYTCIMQSDGGIEKAQDFSVLGITTILLEVALLLYFIRIKKIIGDSENRPQDVLVTPLLSTGVIVPALSSESDVFCCTRHSVCR